MAACTWPASTPARSVRASSASAGGAERTLTGRRGSGITPARVLLSGAGLSVLEADPQVGGEGGREVDDLPGVEGGSCQALEVPERTDLQAPQIHVRQLRVGQSDGAGSAVHEGDAGGGDAAEVELVDRAVLEQDVL